LAGFAHRYAMVCLACAGNLRFLPSLAEAPPEALRHEGRQPGGSQ